MPATNVLIINNAAAIPSSGINAINTIEAPWNSLVYVASFKIYLLLLYFIFEAEYDAIDVAR